MYNMVISFASGVGLGALFHSRRLPLTDAQRAQLHKVRGVLRQLAVSFLLLHIGLHGGEAVAEQGLQGIALMGLVSVVLAVALFFFTHFLAGRLNLADRDTRISLATHFGSVSVGTFATAQAFLQQQGAFFEPTAATWMALMEVPAIIIGVLFLRGLKREDMSNSVRHLVGDPDLLVLVGALLTGYFLHGMLPVVLVNGINFFYTPVLLYFLFDMGLKTGGTLAGIRHSGQVFEGRKLLTIGILTPLVGAALGIMAGTAAGLSIGGVTLLSTLCASSSYVAATAVLRKMVPETVITTSLIVSMGMTLPWNITVGIPLYHTLATSAHDLFQTTVMLAAR
jgi:hypothetical protein